MTISSRHADAPSVCRLEARRHRVAGVRQRACRSRSTSAEASVLHRLEALVEVARRVQALRSAPSGIGSPVFGSAGHSAAAPPAAPASARRAATGSSTKSRARWCPADASIGHVGEQPVQARGRTRGTACGHRRSVSSVGSPGGALAKFMTLTTIGRTSPVELLLVAEARPSRRRCASTAGRSSRRGTGRRGGRRVAHLAGADVRVIDGDVLALGEGQRRTAGRRCRRPPRSCCRAGSRA